MTAPGMLQRASGLVLLVALSACGTATAPAASQSSSAPRATPSTETSAPPSTTPSSTATSTTAASLSVSWVSFTSKRFAFSIDYPEGWLVTEATADSPDVGWPAPDSKAVDRFSAGDSAGRQVSVASDVLAPGEVAQGRRAEIDQENALACMISGLTTVTLDGVRAQQEDEFCFGQDHLIDIFAEHAGRIFLIDWFSKADIAAEDRALFDSMLARFRFED